MNHYLIEIKSPFDGWEPYRIFAGTHRELDKKLKEWFRPVELPTIRYKRLKDDQVQSAKEAVLELWGTL